MIQFVRSSIRSAMKACRKPHIRPQLGLYSANIQCGREGEHPTQAVAQKQRSFLASNSRPYSSVLPNRLNTLSHRNLKSSSLPWSTSRNASTGTDLPKANGYEGVKERTEISVETYHQHADDYLNDVQQVIEELQEEREDVDVEYSVRIPASVFSTPIFSVLLLRSALTVFLHCSGWCPHHHLSPKRNLCHQ